MHIWGRMSTIVCIHIHMCMYVCIYYVPIHRICIIIYHMFDQCCGKIVIIHRLKQVNLGSISLLPTPLFKMRSIQVATIYPDCSRLFQIHHYA